MSLKNYQLRFLMAVLLFHPDSIGISNQLAVEKPPPKVLTKPFYTISDRQDDKKAIAVPSP